MTNNTYEIVTNVIVAMKDVILGGFGGIAAYLYDFTRQKKILEDTQWSSSAMLINLFIGAFVAYSVGTFVPMDMGGRDGIIGFIGVSSYAIMGIIESRFAKIIIDRMIGSNVTSEGK